MEGAFAGARPGAGAPRPAVAELLRLVRSFYPRGPAVDDVVRWVGLEDKRDTWFERLSGGQRQRVAVACALVGDPDLLLLDEPTADLDPQARRRIWELLGELRGAGRTVVLTTHHIDEAEGLCDRVAVIDHGRVIALGTPRELMARVAGDGVIHVTTTPELAPDELAALAAVRSVRPADDGGQIATVTDVESGIDAVLALARARGIRLRDLATRPTTLEDVFVSLTGRELRD